MKSGLNSQELIKSGGVSVAVSNKISVEDLWKKYKDDNVLMGDVMAESYCFYFEKTIDVKKIHYFSLLTPKCCFCKKCNARQYPCQQSINELEAMIKKCYEKSKMDPTVFENKIRKNFALIICKKNRGREQISKRRGKKRAIIAIARMILTAIFQMMTTGEVWNPTDLFKVDMPEILKEKQLSKAVKQATKFLEKQGLTVT